MRIGVLDVQGAVSEHCSAMEGALQKNGIPGSVILVKNQHDIASINALLLPGGESTTISRNLLQSGMHAAISERIQQHTLPIFGTCAGCILLAKKIVDNTQEVQSLNAMDIEVNRNAFGRQKESYEVPINFKGLKSTFSAVFIRAPIITKVWGDCEQLAEIDGAVVAVRQKEFLAVSFHPELTDDLRLHHYFLEQVRLSI